MPRPCTVCQHPSRDRIDAAVIRNRPTREIAKRFGLSRSAIARHANHLDRSVSMAVSSQTGQVVGQSSQTGQPEARTLPDPIEIGAPLLEQVRYLHARTLHVLENVTEPKTALQAVKEARANLEFLARLTGQWVDRHQVTGTVTHELADLDVPALKAKLKELEADLSAIDTEGADVPDTGSLRDREGAPS